jgi:hypothetical protein
MKFRWRNGQAPVQQVFPATGASQQVPVQERFVQVADWQVPAEHTWPRRQAFVQDPQWVASVWRFTQVSPQRV